MKTKKHNWAKVAKRVLGTKAAQNIGDGSRGRFALVTPCRGVDFSLWAREAAESHKHQLSAVGCCGGCWPKTHYVVDLARSLASRRTP